MRKPNFATFDPRFAGRAAGTYDPTMRMNRAGDSNTAGSINAGTRIEFARPANKMILNLFFDNPTAATQTFEAFNFLKSFVHVQNLTYVNGNYLYLPQCSKEGIEAIAANTDGTVGFNAAGQLVIRGLAADPVATLSCKEIPYTSVFNASMNTPFRVSYMRYNSNANNSQIDQNIFFIQDTFAGGSITNSITPRTFQLPSQEIANLIDIPVEFDVAADRGIRMQVLAGQSVNLTLFISQWTLQTLS